MTKKELETLVENLGSVVNTTEKALETTEKNLSKINELNDRILYKAHSILKTGIEEDKALILKNIHGEKPPHFTDEQWEYYKSVGEKLLKI